MKSAISGASGAVPHIAESTRPPRTSSRIVCITSALNRSDASPSDARRSSALTYRWWIMSHTRGTSMRSVGRTRAMSSMSVDRSLAATKYAVPPVARVFARRARPATWLIGM